MSTQERSRTVAEQIEYIEPGEECIVHGRGAADAPFIYQGVEDGRVLFTRALSGGGEVTLAIDADATDYLVES